jgi:predicted enzyme related to lactoylglutathione lyase
MPRLNLIVLRVSDIDHAAGFYRLLGCEFSKHGHGSGPLHYVAEVNGVVFELYSATAEQGISTTARIGFAVDNVDEVTARLAAFAGAKVVKSPGNSEWGRRAVVADPDGHRIELSASGGC